MGLLGGTMAIQTGSWQLLCCMWSPQVILQQPYSSLLPMARSSSAGTSSPPCMAWGQSPHSPTGQHQHNQCQICLQEGSLPPGSFPSLSLWCRTCGAGGPSGRRAEANRAIGEKGGRECPAGAERVKEGMDFGAEYEPCMGPGSGGSRVRPSLTVAPVEGEAGADAR